jgi:hypothetical protein
MQPLCKHAFNAASAAILPSIGCQTSTRISKRPHAIQVSHGAVRVMPPSNARHERGRYGGCASLRAGGRTRNVCLGKQCSWCLIHLDRRQRRTNDTRRPLLPVDRRETLLWNATRSSESGRLHFKFFRMSFQNPRHIALCESDQAGKCYSCVCTSQ